MDDGNNWSYKSAWMCTAEYFANNPHSDLCLNEIKFFNEEIAQYDSFKQSNSLCLWLFTSRGSNWSHAMMPG